MKEIIAVIRMNKVNTTKKALADIGICGMHAMKVMGRGKMQVDFSIINELGTKEEIGGLLAEGLAQGARLIPKRMLTILVQDGDVEKVVNTIIKVNKEGHNGDGKIFVAPVLDALRIRTGEQGEAAV
ncbi:P-II family nitrogen regulator [Desulforamulus hydrothermalis]|uniref:Nitrogen fixation nifHD region glnB-like protein 2 n=1 Tax=Desulforamulus hydrothermalis Lam5 = DSM 18033 TaxID=1121428 RepID=K8E7K9_9FIRM|nr:P-II family nitrogen regulator [Desulforamulus hydrothermalis]CCO07503.1 Nitrogen fixation nifHD region glnB-like protein 2 [Desulforamulus hydrothermalis Lam5 = DSM 18033]SHH17031.1 nitrogen regulatory protein P-II family [Desulforamulus hydrothermalis Lam5 = DSM 18033]